MSVDQEGQDPTFSAIGAVSGDRVVVTVAGEVDMATAPALFEAATPDRITGATIDLRAVTFFDSAAIHTLIRLAERFPGTLEVFPSDRVRRVLDISGLGDQPWLR
ncbi:anti-sigma factor antagonist [Actinoplanes cyaneus]|uniref:Anti-sigma factor antagonist n=1 Tax=Actinoplanes cyaneus TaxID=52696 RepID=A0A919M7N5_9ACTN|nr:STAS domain-containing protein [Actinoplanes cyaneus]MCW2140516.1 anti-anti-sigma factor [Actinoplanes cyaneus]GID67523.1 anti-sigma factor antagonist [Actinoplanes cyaneus]